jgi:hypothetical protein
MIKPQSRDAICLKRQFGSEIIVLCVGWYWDSRLSSLERRLAPRRNVPTLTGDNTMARKKAPSNQGAVWTTKDFAAIRRLVKTGATGKTIAKKIGRSVVALYQKASVEGISLSARPTVRQSTVAKKARAVAASKRRRSR